MARIIDLKLRDIRCFAEEQTANISRITLLVGENSSGKSTFLGCYSTLAKLANLVDLDDKNHFDDPPFHMGSFETFARSGRSDFGLGGTFVDHCHSGASFQFVADGSGKPTEQRVQLEFTGTGNEERTLEIDWLQEPDVLRFNESSFRLDLPRSAISYVPISTWLSRYVRHGYLPYNADPGSFSRGQNSSQIAADAVSFAKFVSFLRSELPLPRGTSFNVEAPDPQLPHRRREYSSQPRYLGTEPDSDLGKVAAVGKKLKLWDAVSVSNTPETGNYQVLVDTPDGRRNLVDVGYGIHSLLPSLGAILSKERDTVFLLQEPEIHLHPSAQAALAQFFVESNHSFLIETHSEHFTDRFRICVMEGILRPQDVSILYFERSADGENSHIHSIGLDSQGNLLNVPTNYRSFFMRETERLMGFAE